MKNKTVGTILLVTSCVCCTLGAVGAKVAYAIEKGMFNLAKGGAVIKSPGLGWEIGFAVIALAILGLVFLFKEDGTE